MPHKSMRMSLTLVLALSALFAAHSDEGRDAEAAQLNQSSASTQPEPDESSVPIEPVEIRLQDAGPHANALPIFYAEATGIFDSLEITLQRNAPLWNASQIVQVVGEGDADVGFTAGNAVVSAIVAGRPVKIVGIIRQGYSPSVFLTAEALASLEEQGVTPSSPISERVEALRGMTIGAYPVGTLGDLALRFALSKLGLDPDSDVTIQPVADQPAMVAAIRQGQLDGGAAQSSEIGGFITNEGLGDVFIDLYEEIPEFAEFPTNVLTVSEEYLSSNPDAVERFLVAMSCSRSAIEQGLTESDLSEIREEHFPDMDAELFRGTIEGALPFLTGGTLVPSDATYQSLLAVMGIEADDAAYEDIFDGDLAQAAEEAAADAC